MNVSNSLLQNAGQPYSILQASSFRQKRYQSQSRSSVRGTRHSALRLRCPANRSAICLAFSDSETLPETASRQQNPFQGHARQPDGIQSFLSNTPKTALLALAIAAVGGSGLLGFLAGSQAPAAQRLIARVIGTAVASGAAVFGVKKLKETRDSAAVIELYAALARHQNIGDLTADEIKAIDSKYGISLAGSRVPEMKAVYDTYIESVIPTTEALKGDEHEKISAFKDALGLSPHDAAAAHTDVGRRFLRLANEADKRSGKSSEYRNGLNRLIYVSSLVFGERQEAFLLPWKRVCNYGDADLIVAKRNQAKALFQSFLENQSTGLPADKAFWQGVKEFQQKIKLDESIAEELIRERARSEVEDHLEKAIECQKRRGRVRDYSDLVREVQFVLDYSLDLEELSKDPEMPKGLGKVTIHGGRLEQGNKSRELRDVFRTYLEEKLRQEKEVSDDLLDDMKDLEVILGMGQKEADDIISESTSRAYRALLRDEVSSGRLDAAESKANVLSSLCQKLNFDPEAAAALHRQLYRQKLDQLLEKKELTDSDATELDRLKRLLCIKKSDIQQIHRDTCGRIYTTALEDALNAGHERFTSRDRDAVKKARKAVRLEPALAKDILAETARRGFMGFITRSRNKPNKLEAAKELKALVYFSNLVVTPLLEDINNVIKEDAEAGQEAARKEIAELMIKAKEMSEQEEAEEAKLASGTNEASKEAQPSQTADSESNSASASDAQPALDALKADAAAAPADGSAPSSSASDEEESVPETLKKSQRGLKQEAEASTSGKGMGSQKEITLREDLDLRDRNDIYKNFLHYCISGNVVALPMGTSVQVQRDQSEFARLAQLGDVLGLTQIDIHAIHQSLAEQAFSSQVQGMMAGGGLSAARVEELEQKRAEFGLSEAAAQKIIKGAQNKQLIDNMNMSKAMGQMTVQRLLEMQEQGINISDVTSDELRATLYTKEMADELTNGSGDFDRERFVVELPKKLGIKERRVKQSLETLAKERKRTTLVQSVSYLRQKKLDEAVKSLNNLLACHKALPSDAKESWQPREELMDLFSVYLGQVGDSGKQKELANILDISEKESDSLRNLVAAGEFKLQDDEADDGDIF